MKRILFSLLVVTTAQLVNAQNVGIGTSTPSASAQLDVTSTTKGLLIPRMTGAQRVAIPTPAIGLLVIQTNTVTVPPSSPGLYLNELPAGFINTVWRRIARADEITGGSSTWTVSGTDQFSNVSGNVGIGTGAPTSKLHVVGNSLVENGNITIDDDFGTLYFKSGNFNKGYVQLRSTNDFKMGTIGINNTTGKLIFETQSIARITVEPDGNVGIGHSNPVAKMDVNGSLRANGNFLLDDGAIYFNNTIDNKTWVVQQNTSSDGLYFVEAGGIGKLMLKNGGNVGINTSSPLTKMHIEGGQDAGLTATSNGYIMNGTGSGTNLIIDNNEIMVRSTYTTPSTLYLQNNGGELAIGARTTIEKDDEALKLNGVNPAMAFYQSGVSKSTIGQVNGDLVLGVTGGGALLLSPVAGSVLVNPSGGGNILLSPTGGGDVIINPNNGGNVQLNPTNGGQVAIGNVVPAASAYKLTVGGKIICEELKVKLQSAGWPDYVFDKKYKLPSLNEVERFIEQNKHLPNIPSAAEVEKNGIEIGDMQKRMMEKIEELTLYIIELKKEIDSLKEKK